MMAVVSSAKRMENKSSDDLEKIIHKYNKEDLLVG